MNFLKLKANLTDKNQEISEIYQLLNIKPINHQQYLSNLIANNNANLFNGTITVNNDKITNFLNNNDLQNQNWISEYHQSTNGLSGYLLLDDNNQLQLLVTTINEINYDYQGKITNLVLASNQYYQNNKLVIILSTYQINNNKTEVTRAIYPIVNNQIIKQAIDFDTYKPNKDLKAKVTLNCAYLPIAIMSNLPSQENDTNWLLNKIRFLDVLWEQIILDCVLNSPKFIFGNLFTNNQVIINRTIKQLIKKNYLFNNSNPNDNPKELVSIIQGNFKGKNLTTVYDWCYQNILTDNGIIYQNNCVAIANVQLPIIQQKIKQRIHDLTKLMTLLINLDNDLLQGKTFNITDVTTIKLDYHIILNKEAA